MHLFETSLYFILVYIHLYNVQCAEATKHPQPGLKYLLMWTPTDTHPFSHWKTSQQMFLQSHCELSNCYVTQDRGLLGDVTKFDAVVFNGRNIRTSQFWPPYNDFPERRSPHQKFIFVDMESADIQTVCDPRFDNFFNLTATYKLNSDILFNYFTIKNKMNETVGPRSHMTWDDPMLEIDEEMKKTLRKKNKAVAWFVPNCNNQRKGRKRIDDYAKELQKELQYYKLTLNIYVSAKNDCNPFICPREKASECEDMLKNDYFFYLAFEDSLGEDFVGREVMKSLLNFNVPIVLGAADYSRFLPPGSYIDTRDTTSGKFKLISPHLVASYIARLIKNPSQYYEYFRWRNHYSYSWTRKVCRLCAALNNDAMMGTQKVYQNFRAWWNPKYERRCSQSLEENTKV